MLHKYLKSVGFSQLRRRDDVKELVRDVVKNYDEKSVIEDHEDGVFAEFTKFYGLDCGVTVCGQYDEQNRFHMDYYFPFFRGTGITTQENSTIEQYSDREAFAGACDDFRLGVTMIYYLQNPAEYMQEKAKNNIRSGQPLTISGLAAEGKVLLPILKDKEAVKVEQEVSRNRANLIAAARNGDEEAMESLTIEDMDTYSMISQRISTDDVLTIVDTYFMPYGIECDQYSVLGEIIDFMTFKNSKTEEEVCQLTVECNDIQFDICINRKDLLGELAVGRRFKGQIWLQGQMHFC